MAGPGPRPPSETAEIREYRLRPGRHRVPPEEVAANQRLRLLAAAGEVLSERGYRRTTAALIARRAAVSASTFYDHFENLDACLLAAFTTAARGLREIVTGPCERGAVPSLRSSIDAGLEFVTSEPALVALLGPELPAAIDAIAAARVKLVRQLAEGWASAAGPSLVVSPRAGGHHLVAAALAVLGESPALDRPEKSSRLAAELAAILSICVSADPP